MILMQTFVNLMVSKWAFALVGPDQVVADASAVAGLAAALVDVDAGVVGQVKAVVASAAEAAVVVDAVAVSAADVGVVQAFVDVDTVAVDSLETSKSNI